MSSSTAKMKIVIATLFSVIAIGYAGDMHDKDEQMNYFKKFAYMGTNNPDPRIGELTDDVAFPMAVRHFQRMAGLPETGQMNSKTIEMMEMPRCGVKDVMTMGDMARRKKRFAPQGSKWPKNNLRYKISKYPADKDLSDSDVDTDIARALDVWASVSPLTFTKVTSNSYADLVVSFEPRRHGDGNDFDGRGGTLAHAFFPQYGGNAHMDEDETWSRKSFRGTNLFQVAAHEFGHSLGLGHSSVQTALMAPFYTGYIDNYQLDSDDIEGIQHIYGKKMRMETTTRPANTPRATSSTTMKPVPEGPQLCNDGSMGDIFMTMAQTVYSFKGDYYSIIDDNGIRPGYPRPISDWPGLPGNIDAAVSIDARFGWVYNPQSARWTKSKLIDERIYFFKGNRVYRYNVFRQLIFEKTIDEEFPGLPSNIDSAFVWGGNGRLYFTKGEEYYRFSFGNVQSNGGSYVEVDRRVDAGYPNKLSVWKGLPQRVDAVFKWRNGRTYFFSGQNYYRYNDNEFRVDQDYPRRTTQWWYGCSGAIEGDSTMMEKDMMNEDQFIEASMGSGEVSGQSVAAPLSILVCILSVFVERMAAML